MFHLPLNSRFWHWVDAHPEHAAYISSSACKRLLLGMWENTTLPFFLCNPQMYAVQPCYPEFDYKEKLLHYNYYSNCFYFWPLNKITLHYFSPHHHLPKEKLAEYDFPNDTGHNLLQKGNVLWLKWHNVDFHAKHGLKDLQKRQEWPHISLEFHLINLCSEFTLVNYVPQ